MTIHIIPETFDKDTYNAAATHPLQSWEWGEARRELGLDVIRLGEFDGDKLINIYQLTLHVLPGTSYKIGYLPRSVSPSDEALKFLQELGKEHHLVFIKFEPNEEFGHNKTHKAFPVKQSSHPLFPEWTQVLDLQPTEDELLKKMKSKTRYNIRLAEKKGVQIREESNEKGFQVFARLYFETCKRQKYYGHNQHFHDVVWKNLKNSISHVLIAYYNDTPLAAYELFYFNNVFYYTYGGSSTEYRNLMGANLLMWEAIKLGKKLGAVSFDMWGSQPPEADSTHPWSGFTRFKEGYGTNFVRMAGSYDLVINPVIYQLYNIVYKVRNFILST